MTKSKIVASMLWRRLDSPGHDACRVVQEETGWSVHGVAIFRHHSGPASLSYSVQCDLGWQTLSGRVRGFVGKREIEYSFLRKNRAWKQNGSICPALGHLVDLDLSFTPATNLQQMRRVPIPQRGSLALPVAWFDLDAGTLAELPQFYESRGENELWYRAPSVDYEGLLEIAPNGFIRHYPRYWEAEPAP